MEHNPWLTIWTRPRSTIAGIVAANPNRSLWWLATVYGFCSLMNMFQSIALGSSMETAAILLWGVILAPIWGYINFTVWSWFVTLVGKWFKGKAHFKEVRAAYAWSCVPITLNIPLWLLMVMLFGHQLFLNYPDSHLLSNGQVLFLFILLIIKVILAIWSLVIYLNALAQVQQFSVLRAILSVVVAGLLVGIVLFLAVNLLAYLGGEAGGKATAFLEGITFLKTLGNL